KTLLDKVSTVTGASFSWASSIVVRKAKNSAKRVFVFFMLDGI
ncbi:MAG: hypothetical protein ACI815_002560, partial [Psychroserpens sp.]